MKHKVFGFKGKSGSGKTTAARMLSYIIQNKGNATYKQWKEIDYSVSFDTSIVSFASEVKRLLSGFLKIPIDCFYDHVYKDQMFLKVPEMTFVKKFEDNKQVNVLLTADNLILLGLNRAVPNVNYYVTLRTLMQYFATELIRNRFFEKAWINTIDTFVPFVIDSEGYCIIDDCRFQNEADYVYDKNGVCIRIYRQGLTSSGHESEIVIKDERDYNVANATTEEDLFYKMLDIYKNECD